MNTPDDITKGCFDTLLAATAADNLRQFVSVGNERFKRAAQARPEVFHRASRKLAPRMQRGFTTTFLGELCHSGYMASLWRIRFDDGGDDLLFRMGITSGKVVGALVGKTLGW